MEQIINILIGAAIASIIPIITLIINQKQWRAGKRIEILRSKHDRLEVIYTQILEKIGASLPEGTWPSDATSKIFVYGSKEVQKVLKEYATSKNRDDESKRKFYYELSESCNKHLLEIQIQIEQSI
ncbi:MAG: hypothetical protein Q8K46_00240 [Deltaproteobacteria bacterium]|nr:hypothetical protein [Deltaproteobacteria bacterium]